MSKIIQYLTLFIFAILFPVLAKAQMVGSNIFIKGRFVEIGIAKNGAFGTTSGVPAGGGYHPRGSGTNLGFVADPAMDGWDVGTPNYVGDYFLPGVPQEGWDMSIDGTWGRAYRDGSGGGGTGFVGGDLTGETIDYDTLGSKIFGVWEGSMSGISITTTTSLDTNKVFFICEVKLKNTTDETVNSIFYSRTLDPDNESSMPAPCGGAVTDNEIVYQPGGGDNKCLVSATGTNCPDYSYLGLGAVDCRAKCYILTSTGGLIPSVGPDEIFDQENDSDLKEEGDTNTGDIAVGIIFNIGNLAPGDSTTFSYAYILRAEDLDSAFASLDTKSWDVDGATLSSSDSTVKCEGGTINVSIEDGGLYTWGDWTPTTGLSETSGPTNTITVGSDTITYRVIGTTILCPTNDTMYITVVPQPVEKPGVDSSVTMCMFHNPVNLFDYIQSGPVPFGTWSGTSVSPEGIFNPTSAGIGVHELRYTVLTGGECEAYNTVIMTIYNNVDIDFDYELVKGCAGDTVNFINNSEPGTYKWNYADGSPYDSGIANPSHFYENQGAYGVWLIVRTEAGCWDSLQNEVSTLHPLEAIFSMDVDSICQNRNISFLDNSIGSIQHWSWDFGDGNTSTTQSPTHNYTLAGYHTVRLIVTDDVPCSDTTYGNVYIDSIPTLELLTDKTEVCNGERINMSLNFLYTANGFTWDFGDGTDLEDGSGTTFHSYNVPGVYNIEVRSHHPVCADAVAYDTVTVKPYPVVNLGPDTTLCLNGAPLFISSEGAVPTGTSWMWSTGDTTAVLKVVHPGTYVANAILDGCTGSDEITVTKDCYTDVPNSFTPNGDGVNDYFYPRQLITKGVTAFNMTVFDRWGQKIFETNNTDGRGWDGKFNEKDQPVGVYIYIINVVFENNTSEKYTGNITLIR